MEAYSKLLEHCTQFEVLIMNGKNNVSENLVKFFKGTDKIPQLKLYNMEYSSCSVLRWPQNGQSDFTDYLPIFKLPSTPTTGSRALLLGLDNSGKTTILYKIKLGELVTTIPTIGFNVEDVDYKNMKITFWDIGGQARIRQLWRHYFPNTAVVVFVVSSNDRGTITEAQEELRALLNEEELRQAPVLILANKQDLPTAMSVSEITRELRLSDIKDRPFHIQGCCATTGDGLYEGLDWIAEALGGSETSSTITLTELLADV